MKWKERSTTGDGNLEVEVADEEGNHNTDAHHASSDGEALNEGESILHTPYESPFPPCMSISSIQQELRTE
jgi:hypothetical protein